MWKLIYHTVHIGFAIAIILGAAVVLSVVSSGPLALWLAIVVLGSAGLYFLGLRRQAFTSAQPFAARPLTPQSVVASPSDAATTGPTFAATQPIATSPITATLPRPSTRTTQNAMDAVRAIWPSEWSPSLGADEVRPSSRALTSFWALSRSQVLFFLALAFTAVVSIGLRAWQLSTLQAEPYGDINIISDYVSWIRNGEFPFRFLLSTGPLYHYLLMPFVWLFGTHYDTYKVFSTLVSLAGIAVTYLASRRLLFALQPVPATAQRQADWFAVLVAFVMGVSSWFLIFSRLGNSQILVPLLIMLAVWLLLRFVQDNDQASLIWCAVASALGLYVYPQSFVLPVAIALVLLVFKIAPRSEIQALAPRRLHTPITWANLLLFCGVVVLCALPFPFIVANSSHAINSYIVPKLSAQQPANILVTNIINTLLAYHIQGDVTFRSNPVHLPHLDGVSGILMLIGFVYWFRRNRLVWLALLILFVVLQLPSVLVLIEPVETPSASRTLGAAPIAYIWVASGLWGLLTWLRNRSHTQPAAGQPLPATGQPLPATGQPATSNALLLTGVALIAILGLNINRYFNNYISGLPYNNTPIARLIIDYANLLPPTTQVYVAGCCWERGMPEPKGITYEVDRPANLHHLAKPDTLTCEKVQQYPAGSVLIWNYKQPVPTTELLRCQNLIQPQVYSGKNGSPAFHAAVLWSGPVVDPAVESIEAPTAIALSAGQTQLAGLPVQVLHSALDIGSTADMFDQITPTLARGEADNPFTLVLQFDVPRQLSGIALTLGTMTDVQFTAVFTTTDGRVETVNYESTTLPPDPRVELKLPGDPQGIQAVRVDILDRRPPPEEGFHTHVREVELLP